VKVLRRRQPLLHQHRPWQPAIRTSPPFWRRCVHGRGAVRLRNYLAFAVALLRLTTSLFDVADCVTLTKASPLATSPAAQPPLVAGISTRACDKGRFLRRAQATEPDALRSWRREVYDLLQREGVTAVTSLVNRYRFCDDVPRRGAGTFPMSSAAPPSLVAATFTTASGTTACGADDKGCCR
jgi:hypothetical protein